MKTTLLILTASMLAALSLLSACATETENAAAEKPEAQAIVTKLPKLIPQTGWTDVVPSEYLTPAAHPGTVERLDCATKDYAGGGADIQKTAYVYLPPRLRTRHSRRRVAERRGGVLESKSITNGGIHINAFTHSYPVKVYFGEQAAEKNLAAELAKHGKNYICDVI